jgi:hypothetical protein
MTMRRAIGQVVGVTPPFDAGKWVEITARMDDGGTETFLWPAQDAADMRIGQAIALTIEALLN